MKNELIYSFNLSSRENCIFDKTTLMSVSKWFENPKDCINNGIIKLIGGDNIYDDVKQLYDDIFTEFVIKHDKKTRGERKIRDYFEKMSDSPKQHIVEEITIQIGDKNFWKDRDYIQHKDELTDVFKDQLERLQVLVPDFKIANATIYCTKTHPYMHIIGIPTKQTPDKTLQLRVSKDNCFSADRLEILQDKMGDCVVNEIQEIYQDENISERKKINFKNINYSFAEYKYVKRHKNELRHKYSEQLKEYENKLKERNLKLEIVDNIYTLQEQKEKLQNEIKELKTHIEELKSRYDGYSFDK